MSGLMGRPMIAAPVPRMARRTRSPRHNFYAHFVPWVLQPICFAPVLPGETLKRFMFQGRVLTTPLANNQVAGWWLETYWFYVKHRHMTNSSTYLSMMINMDTSLTAAEHTTAIPYYQSQIGDLRFAIDGYKAIVDEFFRGDGENSDTADGVRNTNERMVRLNLPGWWDSILPAGSVDTLGGGVADDSIGGAGLDQVGELGRALEQWQQLRMLGITNMEYDDWLRSFGVSIAAPMEDRPELLRYTREWQEPSSAVSVDATSQRVSSVVSWKLMERADKNRYFKEPGLIMGFVVARPKLYHDRQQAGVGMLKSAPAWQTPFATGLYDGLQPVQGLSGYLFDTGDLFNQGDQYRYISRGTSIPTLAFPADGKLDYANDTLINSLFTDAASGHVKIDGVVSLDIATGAVGRDATPTSI